MTGHAFTHRHGPPNWFFAKGPRRGGPAGDDIDDLIALRGMWRGGPFGGPGWGPHRHGRGRARRGDVRLALLRLLGAEPRNGYKLIKASEDRSEGLGPPSPGSVSPTCPQLGNGGLGRSLEAGGPRRFEITD